MEQRARTALPADEAIVTKHDANRDTDVPREGTSSGIDSDFTLVKSGTPGEVNTSNEARPLECNAIILPAKFANDTTSLRERASTGTKVSQKKCSMRRVVSRFTGLPSEENIQHLNPLYVEAHFNGVSIGRVLVDNRASINVLPFTTFRKLQRSASELVDTDVVVSGFNGRASAYLGVIPIALQLGSRTKETAFFVIDVVTNLNALLGRD